MSVRFLCLVLGLFMIGTRAAGAVSFDQRLDFQTRFDQRSDRDNRWQYRIRYYPKLNLTDDDTWSLNSMVVTGDDFSSSHNSLDGSTNYLYARRLFVRKQYDWGKTEVGGLPTYKGRVSLSGLSKDGWIFGARQVVQLDDDTAFEVVAGYLDSLDPAHALDWPDELNYLEVEYSHGIDAHHSMELGFERMLEGSFVRGEYRYDFADKRALTFELIQRLDTSQNKVVIGFEGPQLWGTNIQYEIYYAYNSNSFGPRAELTEDFIGEGHNMSLELGSGIDFLPKTDWFVRYDWVEGTNRLLTGLVIKI